VLLRDDYDRLTAVLRRLSPGAPEYSGPRPAPESVS
jgi:hypothetical protein